MTLEQKIMHVVGSVNGLENRVVVLEDIKADTTTLQGTTTEIHSTTAMTSEDALMIMQMQLETQLQIAELKALLEPQA